MVLGRNKKKEDLVKKVVRGTMSDLVVLIAVASASSARSELN